MGRAAEWLNVVNVFGGAVLKLSRVGHRWAHPGEGQEKYFQEVSKAWRLKGGVGQLNAEWLNVGGLGG